MSALQASPRRHHAGKEVKDIEAGHSGGVQSDDKEGKPERAGRPVKIEFLDGLRGLAAMLVVHHHSTPPLQSSGTGTTQTPTLHLHQAGSLGVDIFFVLSSFLLTMILEKKLSALYNEKASLKRWGYALVDYFVRRILRVYPLYMAVVFVLAVSSDEHKLRWYHIEKAGDQFSIIKTLMFAKGYRFFIFWTLPVEIAYYFIIPVFVAVVMSLGRWWWLPIGPLLAWIFYAGFHVYRHSAMGLWPHLPTFVCGSIGAVVCNRLGEWIKSSAFELTWWQRSLVRCIEWTLVLLIISVSFHTLLFDWFGPYPFKIMRGSKEGDRFVSFYVVVVIVCETLAPGDIAKVFEWSLLRYAGKISFSMYLLHPRILFSDTIRSQNESDYAKFCSTWILLFFWATVSYHAVEYPCQWLAGRIGKRIKELDVRERTLQID